MLAETRCLLCGAVVAATAAGGICLSCRRASASGRGDSDDSTPPTRTDFEGDRTTRTDLDQRTRVGPYRLLETVGTGGMGVVYLAEQETPIRRRVALKLIKLGMDTRQVVARFEAERQALALMDHPHIAAVYDTGATEDGRPYFVMEYVAGLSITAYCDRHRLPTRERLALFTKVCGAVQHAHQKGVIHRDLKPSNVLVAIQDGHPVPKVIDFGVAKATNQRLTERTLFTEQGLIIGTPEYMSPEQAEMSALDVDTTSDIYSLGVLLYELLVGALPFDPAALRRAGYAEIQRIIREEEPARPSTKLHTLGVTARDVASRRQTSIATLVREVSGDLDCVVLKAMDKDRTRRYSSASELALDLDRHLAAEPVLARPPSVVYRTSKFVRRHRVSVIAASLVIAAIVTGLAVSTAMYLRARDESRRNGAMASALAAWMRDAESNNPELVSYLPMARAVIDLERPHARRNPTGFVVRLAALPSSTYQTARRPGVGRPTMFVDTRVFASDAVRAFELEVAAQMLEVELEALGDGDLAMANLLLGSPRLLNHALARAELTLRPTYEAVVRQLIRLQGPRLGPDPTPMRRLERAFGGYLQTIGRELLNDGDPSAAESVLREAFDLQAPMTEECCEAADTLQFLAQSLERAGRGDEAAQRYEEAERLLARALDRENAGRLKTLATSSFWRVSPVAESLALYYDRRGLPLMGRLFHDQLRAAGLTAQAGMSQFMDIPQVAGPLRLQAEPILLETLASVERQLSSTTAAPTREVLRATVVALRGQLVAVYSELGETGKADALRAQLNAGVPNL